MLPCEHKLLKCKKICQGGTWIFLSIVERNASKTKKYRPMRYMLTSFHGQKFLIFLTIPSVFASQICQFFVVFPEFPPGVGGGETVSFQNSPLGQDVLRPSKNCPPSPGHAKTKMWSGGGERWEIAFPLPRRCDHALVSLSAVGGLLLFCFFHIFPGMWESRLSEGRLTKAQLLILLIPFVLIMNKVTRSVNLVGYFMTL